LLRASDICVDGIWFFYGRNLVTPLKLLAHPQILHLEMTLGVYTCVAKLSQAHLQVVSTADLDERQTHFDCLGGLQRSSRTIPG